MISITDTEHWQERGQLHLEAKISGSDSTADTKRNHKINCEWPIVNESAVPPIMYFKTNCALHMDTKPVCVNDKPVEGSTDARQTASGHV